MENITKQESEVLVDRLNEIRKVIDANEAQILELRQMADDLERKIAYQAGRPGPGEKFTPAGPPVVLGPNGGIVRNNPLTDIWVGDEFLLPNGEWVIATGSPEAMLTDQDTLMIAVNDDDFGYVMIPRHSPVEVAQQPF